MKAKKMNLTLFEVTSFITTIDQKNKETIGGGDTVILSIGISANITASLAAAVTGCIVSHVTKHIAIDIVSHVAGETIATPVSDAVSPIQPGKTVPGTPYVNPKSGYNGSVCRRYEETLFP